MNVFLEIATKIAMLPVQLIQAGVDVWHKGIDQKINLEVEVLGKTLAFRTHILLLTPAKRQAEAAASTAGAP